MQLDKFFVHMHGGRISRREALRMAAQAGAAGAVASLGAPALHPGCAHAADGDAKAAAQPIPSDEERAPARRSWLRDRPRRRGFRTERPTDRMFDVDAVERGAWVPGPYGRGDQRGTFNEVTARKTASALAMLANARAVHTYNLGDLMFNGYPAYTTAPPRVYDQRLTVLGYVPKPTFTGILQSPVPLGPNRVSAHEERFPLGGTYQIATQLDNLNHVGVGRTFYNGFQGPEIAEGYGTNKLGNEHMGPLITRGVLLDIIGLKVARGQRGAYFRASNGRPVLNDDYRITLDDLKDAMRRGGIRRIKAGDVVLLRTGWNQLVRTDPLRYLAKEPGIYLREARWLAARFPAIVGGDAWALEVLDEDVTKGNLFPVHQLLLMRYGIRIGEGIVTDHLAEDGVFEFVYGVTPQYARGATAGNTPPFALAPAGRRGPAQVAPRFTG